MLSPGMGDSSTSGSNQFTGPEFFLLLTTYSYRNTCVSIDYIDNLLTLNYIEEHFEVFLLQEELLQKLKLEELPLFIFKKIQNSC